MPPSTELPSAAWSAEADVGAERRNPVPLSQKSRCLAGRRPAKARRATPNRRRARSNQTARRLPRGFLWPRGDRGTPRVLMMPPSRGAWRCKRGRGRSLPGRADRPQRWQSRRAETVLAATVGHRHARAAALDGKRKGVKGTLAALLRLRPSRTARDGSPISTQLPHARPGAAMRTRGAVDTCFAPPRIGGANPVVARSVTRRTRPSHSSGSGAGRTGRCAGTRPRPDRC